MILQPELVPKTSHFQNLRSLLTSTSWDKIRKEVYKRARYRCEICGGAGSKHPVEAHEIWEYNDETGIQKLTGIVALCPTCHQCKHFGLSVKRGGISTQERLLKHMAKVNRCSYNDTVRMVEKAFEVWAIRSQKLWTLDVEYILRDPSNG